MATYYSPEDLNRMSREEMANVLRHYSKTANQRLRELEKHGYERTSAAYRQVNDWSEQGMDYITRTRSGEIKFKTSPKGMTLNEMRREVSELHTFLFRAKTSTVKGTKSHYERILDSIQHNENPAIREFFGNMNMEEFSQFWENEAFRQITKRYGSDVIIEIQRITGEENLEDVSEVLNRVLEEINLNRTPLSDFMDRVERYVISHDTQEDMEREMFSSTNVDLRDFDLI